MPDSLDMSMASFISSEPSNSQTLPPKEPETPPSPPSPSSTSNSRVWIQDPLPPLQPVTKPPSTTAFIKGHAQYLAKSVIQFIFKDNNLPLLINLVYHLIAARALLGRPWKTVTRYLSIPPTPQSSSSLKYQIEQTTSIAMDAFKAQGALHVALAALAGLALKERRQSSERSALFVLACSSLGQTYVHLNSYWKSNQQYTLKALQEVCTSDVGITFISLIAWIKTAKRTRKWI